MIRAVRFVVAAGLVGVLAFAVSAQPAKPRVPPARDPGGVAVAVIGPGVDYTRPEIASRLARDGEGEIIGWDFIDGDRRPYEQCSADKAVGCASAIALMVLQDASTARLVVVRAAGERPQTIVQAVQMVARSPARIVLLAGPAATADPALIVEAAARNPAVLFIAPAAASSAAQVANLITVTAAPSARPASADIAAHMTDLALVRVATLAAKLLTAAPRLDAAGLKQRIMNAKR